MARRSKAREVALQMLFQVDLNPDVDGRTVRGMIAERLQDEDLREFAWMLFSGVMETRAQLDERIQAVASNWKLSRMAGTDRNCLRQGAFELIHTDAPYRVVIDEALELARKFGSDQSAQFVNGILDKLVPPEKRAIGDVPAAE
jgi:N utilization substance protein B